MFCLALLRDVLPLDPITFNKDTYQEIRRLIHAKYVDRVINDVGVGVALYGVEDIEGARILPGDGRAHLRVRFKLIVFRPFLGEVLQGHIISESSEGIQVALGDVFNDVTIPLVFLREPRRFSAEENQWYWDYEEEHSLPYRVGAPIRFRVKEIEFLDTNRQDKQQGPPMTILGSVAEDGLGPRSWWD